MKTINELMKHGPVIGDGGYLIELERRGYVDSGSGREQVGTGRGSGQFTPEVAIEHPDALRELHREFLNAGSQVLQALTFFGTREKLDRAGYGAQVEEINSAAVKLAKEVAGDKALVAGSVSRTQLVEREGMDSLSQSARPHRRANSPAQGRRRRLSDSGNVLSSGGNESRACRRRPKADCRRSRR